MIVVALHLQLLLGCVGGRLTFMNYGFTVCCNGNSNDEENAHKVNFNFNLKAFRRNVIRNVMCSASWF